MNILVNKKVKSLFNSILLCVAVFMIISLGLIYLKFAYAALAILLCALGMALVILGVCYKYFKEQHKIIEDARCKITDYIGGNHEARIPCNEEGQLYRLFHEVNELVAILNAHGEKELRTKEFLKNTMADISHQLKTPLAALNIYNGILQEETGDLPELEKFTKLSEQELDRIETLVQNLLKITKMDAGTVVLEKKLENVAEMMACVRQHFLFRAQQEKKEIQLVGSETVTLQCNHDWLIEAIDNIVKNALDHTKMGEWVHIEWKQFASVVQIIIKDNGCGINPADLHHIFKRFYRSKFSKDIQGVGLGLPLAKSIIEAHKGTVEVESEIGVGTTFIINFLIPTKL